MEKTQKYYFIVASLNDSIDMMYQYHPDDENQCYWTFCQGTSSFTPNFILENRRTISYFVAPPTKDVIDRAYRDMKKELDDVKGRIVQVASVTISVNSLERAQQKKVLTTDAAPDQKGS